MPKPEHNPFEAAPRLAVGGGGVLLERLLQAAVDLDPQANLSVHLGIDIFSRSGTIYDVLTGEAGLDEIVATEVRERLDVAPSHIDLSGVDVELASAVGRERLLKEAIDEYFATSQRDVDFVLIDCPPSLGILTMNAMTAVEEIFVPLQCEFFALEGMSQLIKTIERVKSAFNPELDIQGIVLTMHDCRNNLSQMVANDVRDFFGAKVYKTVIPRNVRVSEAPSHGLPVMVYDLNCAGSQAYLSLAGEVIHRERRISA